MTPGDRTRRAGRARGRHPRRPRDPSCRRRRRSLAFVLGDRKGLHLERATLVPRQELDALLGLIEIPGAVARQAHALLEDLEGLLQRETARLELIHDPLEALERVLKLDVAHLVLSPAPRGR